MKKLLLALFLVALFGCKKERATPTPNAGFSPVDKDLSFKKNREFNKTH